MSLKALFEKVLDGLSPLQEASMTNGKWQMTLPTIHFTFSHLL